MAYRMAQSFEEWRHEVLTKQPGGGGSAGCLLALTTLGVTLAGCAAIGAVVYQGLYDSGQRAEGRRVALCLALPAIALGIGAFYLFAPMFYRLHLRSTRQSAPVPLDEKGSASDFLHRLLPKLAFGRPMTLLENFSYPGEATSRVRAMWKSLVNDEETWATGAGDIEWISRFVAERPCAVLRFPTQPVATVHMVGIVFDLQVLQGKLLVKAPFVLYFLLEADAVSRTRIAEQMADGNRAVHGPGPAADDVEGFIAFMDREASGRLGPSGLTAEQLQTLIPSEAV